MWRCEIGDSAYRAFTVILRTEFQLFRPHGEEARAARRLEPWQQVRTRGHPSRRPRFARAPQDEVAVVERFIALRMTEIDASSNHMIRRELAAVAVGLDLKSRMIDLELCVQLLRRLQQELITRRAIGHDQMHRQ